jgi:hypothetical protein
MSPPAPESNQVDRKITAAATESVPQGRPGEPAIAAIQKGLQKSQESNTDWISKAGFILAGRVKRGSTRRTKALRLP